MTKAKRRMNRDDAQAILADCNIPRRADFHTLSMSQVDALLSFADKYKYREPETASGSRARYFHAFVDRLAHTKVELIAPIPRINMVLETKENGITGTMYLNVVRVEREDDGSFTAVSDFWPPR